MVAKVRAALNVRFPGGDAPTTLFTDRGPGFFHPGTGAITAGFQQALRDHGLRAFMADDAALQPGALQEVMLHETAVAWCRYELARCLPARPWLEAAVAEVNATHDVDSLCKELPARVAQLILERGGRLAK